ncbi:MAG: ABC transporter permease, partial [bacterium]|nr:ABC transporter permease [bacterium]
LFLLALSFGTLALLIGSFTGSKGMAIGLTTAVAVLTFFINALAPIVDFLEKIQKASPFYHYTANNPIVNGLDWVSVFFFTCISLVFLILSIVAFRKRDLMI